MHLNPLGISHNAIKKTKDKSEPRPSSSTATRWSSRPGTGTLASRCWCAACTSRATRTRLQEHAVAKTAQTSATTWRTATPLASAFLVMKWRLRATAGCASTRETWATEGTRGHCTRRQWARTWTPGSVVASSVSGNSASSRTTFSNKGFSQDCTSSLSVAFVNV